MASFRFVLVLVAFLLSGLALPVRRATGTRRSRPRPDPKIGEKLRTSFCLRPVYVDGGGGGLRAEVFEMALRLERLNAMVEFGLLRPQAGQLPYPRRRPALSGPHAVPVPGRRGTGGGDGVGVESRSP